MTSTPVRDVSFGLNGVMPAGAKNVSNGGFQAVWNNQTEKRADDSPGEENGQSVRKTPGDSLKARDEHRARTETREPSRDVEERADIPEEKLEEAMSVLGTAAAELIEQVAETFEVSPEEVLGAMKELEMGQLEILEPGKLGKLILAVAGTEDASALVTSEELYGSYQELMAQLESVLQDSAETLGQPAEQLPRLLEQLQPEESVEGVILTETTDDAALPEMKEGEKGEVSQIPETMEQSDATEAVGAKVSAERQSEGKESHHEGGKEQETGLFAQNLRTEQFEPQVQQTEAPESVWDADTQNIMRQIMDYLKVNLKSDMSSMEMQLHPASLGTLQVQVAAKGGVITANFITQNETVKAALESQMIQLKEQFQEQGIKVEAIEVTVQTHEFERNLDQGRGNSSQGQEPSKKGRIRRINLNDSISAEEMEEEDALAKDIMETNGNTVDYSV